MPYKLMFKSTREEEEFWNDKITDPRIRAITLELARYSKDHFGKEMVVTCVGRTPAEQIEIYGEDTPSAHKFNIEKGELCRAVDIRSTTYTQEELFKLKNYFAKWFDLGYLYSFLVHNIGDGVHIHLQCAPLNI